MNEINKEKEKIIALLIKSGEILDAQTDSTFDKDMLKVRALIAEANECKKTLQNRYDSGIIKVPFEEIMEITKLLNKKFDNIIEKKSLERIEVAKKINTMNNQKKLSQYQR